MTETQPKRILVFRIGSLGDTLVSVPAMWAIRERFPEARMTLLCDKQAGADYVLASEVFAGAGLIDEVVLYPVDRSFGGRLLKPWRMLRLLGRLQAGTFDALAYLAPSCRGARAIARDVAYFRRAGIRAFIGTAGFVELPKIVRGKPLARVEQEGDLLLARLAASGLPVPEPGRGRCDLNLGEAERAAVEKWRAGLPGDGGRPWIAIGPGSKMPLKIWPRERFREVVSRLIEEFDVWPVVFGGAEDRPLGASLVREWQRGAVAAGALNVRESVAALERCRIYLGNDTGAMHLAAAAGVRCVGIFSARYYPGNWAPYGAGHITIQESAPCAGCLKTVCDEYGMRCILDIGVDDVQQACRRLLGEADANSGEGERD